MVASRREFVAGAVAFAAVARADAQPALARRGVDVDVIVVGAGISGLNAAWLLEQEGARVMMLEGRQRVGGRIHTLLDEPGYPEMGFNSMGAGYGRGLDAAARAGVDLVDRQARFARSATQLLVLDGQVIARPDWAAHPSNPFPPALRELMPWEVVPRLISQHNRLSDWTTWNSAENAGLDVSMHAFLAARGLSDAAIQLAFDTAPYHGSTSHDVSALLYEFTDGWTKAQIGIGAAAYAAPGGNIKLPIALAKLLRADQLFGKEVAAVSSDAAAATVTCRDGTSYRAKRVVMSVPFSTLRDIAFQPGLSGAQARAVRTMAYQPMSIMFVRVARPFWEQDRLDPSMWTNGLAGTVSAQRFGASDEEVTGFLVQARGRLARQWDRLGAAAVQRLVVAEIERLRPAAKGLLEARSVHSWTLDRFSAGDWAVFGPGEVSAFAETMAVPAGRIHFAGEHTASANRGLEGALESSERVVAEVLDAL